MPNVLDTFMITNHNRRDQEAKCHSNLENITSVRIEVATAACIKIIVFLEVQHAVSSTGCSQGEICFR
jgi:hypothetical protein